ncbi:hypothetical protein AAFF_G00138030 [Aldrovandia affinis]|uniref:Uncharacterized protein n=1 Tax=Aldrovandia affinis TaxID=143900 RepID=A0AAD7X3Q0_9TELE|nr:hypothetical protein AAFF_G00138030 [Aldrovandia affinis]
MPRAAGPINSSITAALQSAFHAVTGQEERTLPLCQHCWPGTQEGLLESEGKIGQAVTQQGVRVMEDRVARAPADGPVINEHVRALGQDPADPRSASDISMGGVRLCLSGPAVLLQRTTSPSQARIIMDHYILSLPSHPPGPRQPH